jgi:hypothetical protein
MTVREVFNGGAIPGEGYEVEAVLNAQALGRVEALGLSDGAAERSIPAGIDVNRQRSSPNER